MEAMATGSETIVLDDVEAIPEAALPEFFEVIDGEVVGRPAMGLDEGLLANDLKRFLDAYLARNPLGRALTEILFDLRPAVNRSRRPDAAFVSFERWPRGRRLRRGNAMPAAPEVAAEVVSYPSVEEVYAYESTKAVRVLGRDDELDGGDVLPGFRLPLAELFVPEEGEPA